MTVREMEDRMTINEFRDWLAFFALEREAEERRDLQQTTQVALTRAR